MGVFRCSPPHQPSSCTKVVLEDDSVTSCPCGVVVQQVHNPAILVAVVLRSALKEHAKSGTILLPVLFARHWLLGNHEVAHATATHYRVGSAYAGGYYFVRFALL